ncbi:MULTISPECIES: hypothetical protein [Mammaliicoccus]|uniref:hypothetical protein n=1 Tax=Mammaliicoccus TaxID=2803850 RepID=UPI001EFAF887|nr:MULTISPECIES: hypothetical protein [Mammaliicoccus]WQK51568.1 hypothetical protein P3U54_14370 [Mammaliicoccus lentus]
MKNLTKEKLRDMLRQETIKSLKKHNEILQPLEINFDSDLDDNEIDYIIKKLNNINKENSKRINSLLIYKNDSSK